MSASRELCSLRITERDRAIIADVARYGAASRRHLMALGHFGSTSRANRRLRVLTERKYLRRTHVATGPNQNATIYLIGPAGTSIAVEDLCLDPIELKRQGQRSPERMYLEHHLGILSLCLTARRDAGDVRLRSFLAEPECRHEYEVVDRSRTVKRLVKPDAMALFDYGDILLPVFIEFDRGNTSLPQMSGLFSRYSAYWTDTAFQRAYDIDTPFTVAVVTTAGHRRIDHLLRLTAKSVVPVKLTTLSQVEAEGFHARIWRSAQTDEVTVLRKTLQSGGGP
jgi:hypothetical protein